MSNNNNTDTTTTCGISSPLTTCTEALSNDLTCLHPSHFFSIHHPTNSTHNNDDVDDYHHHNCITGSGSPVMYSNHAPALSGLTKCEYCGCPNVKLCPGVKEVQLQLREYQRRVMREDGVILPEEDVSSMQSVGVNNNLHDTTISTTSTNNTNTTMNKCHRPKLFFLKKRPPFASTNDTGWNPTTQHRTLLFEPPSSMEGISRGYGEVRGRLGGFDTVNYTSPKLSVGGGTSGGGGGLLGGSMRSGYRMDRRSLSLPLRHGGSASGGGGGNKGRCDSISGEVEVRSLSASHHHRVASSSGITVSSSASLVNGGGGGRRSPVVMMNRQYSRSSTGGGSGGNSSSKINVEEVEGGRSLSPWNNWFG